MYTVCISFANYFVFLWGMKKEPTKSYPVRMAPSLHELAEGKAKTLGLNFSAYVRYLISMDVNRP